MASKFKMTPRQVDEMSAEEIDMLLYISSVVSELEEKELKKQK